MYLWLGLSKHKKDFLNGLPKGYEESRLLQIANKPHAVPPEFIHYNSRLLFVLTYNVHYISGIHYNGKLLFVKIQFNPYKM